MIKMIQIYTLLLALFLVVLFGSSIMAAPLEAEEKSSAYSFMNEKLPEELETNLTRYRRATCRIPIIGSWVNDSACAAGCIARGRAGGKCRNEICHCREEEMLDLIRKRFNF